jgi:uncharacterized protein (TIRG00374 family)
LKSESEVEAAAERWLNGASRPSRTSRLVFCTAGFVVLLFLCRRLGLGELEAALDRVDPWRFAAFLALSFTVFLSYALRWRVVLEGMSTHERAPSVLDLVWLRAAEHAVSTLVPSGHLSGEPVRAFLLRRRVPSWRLSVASVAMDRMLDFTASSVVGPLYVGIFFLAHGSAAWAAPWVVVMMLAPVSALVLFYVYAYRGDTLLSVFARSGFAGAAEDMLRGLDQYFAAFLRTRAFAGAFALALASEALVLAELWMLARAFGLPVSAPTLLGVMIGMGVAQIVPVPAALGSLEATEVGILTLAGGAAPLGLAVGLVIRIRETLWILVGLAVLYLEGLTLRGPAPALSATMSENTSAIDPNA